MLAMYLGIGRTKDSSIKSGCRKKQKFPGTSTAKQLEDYNKNIQII